MKINGYTQIPLHEIDWSYYDNRDGLKWSQKIIEKAGFCKDGDRGEQMLLITFTDKTFICVTFDYKENNNSTEDEFELQDNWLIKSSQFEEALAKYHSYIDSEGKVCFDLWVQMLLDFGFYQLTPEKAKEIKEAHFKHQEELEYANYLRLKEKFEGKKPRT